MQAVEYFLNRRKKKNVLEVFSSIVSEFQHQFHWLTVPVAAVVAVVKLFRGGQWL